MTGAEVEDIATFFHYGRVVDCRVFGPGHGEVPGQGDALEDFDDFFVRIYGEDDLGLALAELCVEAAGCSAASGGKVGLDPDEGGASL